MHDQGRVMAPRHCPHCGGYIPPERDANLPDLMVLLTLCRDALDQGHGDLCRAVLHLIVEHRTRLGLRSRNLARRLAAQMAERDRAQSDDQQ
jgi:hypothetical protein